MLSMLGETHLVASSGNDDGTGLAIEQRREIIARREKRIATCLAALRKRLTLRCTAENAYSDREFAEYARQEAEALSRQSFGPELLVAIGYMYVQQAKQFLTQFKTFGGIRRIAGAFREVYNHLIMLR